MGAPGEVEVALVTPRAAIGATRTRLTALVGDLSLQARLVGLVGGVVGVVSVFLLLFFPARMDANARAALARRATGLAQLLADRTAPALEFDDGATARSALEGLATTGDALFAVVLRADGSTLAGFHEERAPAHLLAPGRGEPAVAILGDRVEAAAPIVTRSADRGVLVLALGLDEVQREARANLVTVALAATAVLTFGLVLAVVVGRLLSQPIRRMTVAADLIAALDLRGAEEALGGRASVAALAAGENATGRGDEVKRLAHSLARMLETLRQTSTTLQDSSRRLVASVGGLGAATGAMSQAVDAHLSVVRQSGATAAQVRQISQLATDRARTVVEDVRRTEELAKGGDHSVERVLEGFAGVRAKVGDIAAVMDELGNKVRHIGAITGTVKELADQSNMLALNAAIEAVRSGEHGKGFGVVAREIRSLADQSIEATRRVAEILGEVAEASRRATSATTEGVRQVDDGLAQARSFGESLRAFASTVRGGGEAVQQLATAVRQQDDGFAHVISAVQNLSTVIEATAGHVEAAREAAGVVDSVAQQMRAAAGQYKL